MVNKKYIVIIGIVVAAIIGAVLLLPVRAPETLPSGKMEAAASFYPLAFFAGEIGGDRAVVTSITPAGAEPHDYELTAGDRVRIERSRLLILNGGGFEAWGSKISENREGMKTIIINVGEGLTAQQVTEEGETAIDPHIWLSPLLAQKIAGRILEGFVKVDPLHSAEYQERAVALMARLADLDRSYREGLRNCAEKNIITSHAAFGHLAAAYGLRQVPIAGLSPDEEPSAEDLGRIVEFAKENNIRAIFFEALASPKLSQTIAREIGARTLILNPLEGLTSDEIAQGENYFTVMQDNLKNLQSALLCQL